MHMMVNLVAELLDANCPSGEEATVDHIVQAGDATDLVEDPATTVVSNEASV